MHVNPKGRNWGDVVNWDDLGKLYAGLIITWTIILYTGVGWLLWNRRMPFVRMRNLPIAITSTCFLHIYLVKIMLAYTTNGHFDCGAEFWIMSIYLPFGIALFQANLTQLRSISERQERLLTRHLSFDKTPAPEFRGYRKLLARWKGLSETHRSYVYITIGLVAQVIVTAVLYATTPELQGDWSSFGDVPHSKGQGLCRKTLQWIPSAFWQLFWTWVYGPFELYKIRNIRDAHRWRFQTILCILVGLPGAPLWLASVYTKNLAWKPVNIWFVPPMWLAPGIIVMQFATIFFPIFEIFEHRHSLSKTAHSIGSDTTLRTSYSFSEAMEKGVARSDSTADLFDELQAASAGRLYSLGALERALLINPAPLLNYAATQDFTAENIIFLNEVKCWHEAWKAAPRESNGLVTNDARVRLFQMAVEIFITSIYEKTAEFPVNVEGHIRRELTDLFGPAVPEGKRESGESGRVRPVDSMFGMGPNSKNGIDLNRMNDLSAIMWQDKKVPTFVTIAPASPSFAPPSPDTIATSQFSSAGTTPDVIIEENPFTFESHPSVSPLGKAGAKIRPGFDQNVFDAAEASIKYLVLTNTWRKFVQMRERDQQARISTSV